MAWEKVEPRRSGERMDPMMAIQRTGKLSWTKGLDLRMGSPARVAVFWDPIKWRIGIRPAGEDEGFAAGVDRRYVGVCAAMKGKEAWSKLEFPIGMRPACQDDEGIWAISVKPDGLLFGEVAPAKKKKRPVPAVEAEDEASDAEP